MRARIRLGELTKGSVKAMLRNILLYYARGVHLLGAQGKVILNAPLIHVVYFTLNAKQARS